MSQANDSKPDNQVSQQADQVTAGSQDEPKAATAKEVGTVKNEESVTPSTATKASNTIEPAQKVIVKKSGVLVWFSLLIALSAVAAAGWLGWQFWQFQQNYQGQQSKLQQHLVQQQNTLLQQLEQRQQQLQKQWQQNHAAQNRTLEQLVADIRRKSVDINQESARVDSHQLISIASKRLWLEADRAGALKLLQAAQTRIANLTDPHWQPLKKALAEDIGTVKALPAYDSQQVYLQLLSIGKAVMKLPVNQVEIPAAEDKQADLMLSDSATDWQQNLYKTWRKLTQDFVTVKRRVAEVQPLMLPEHESNLRQNILGKITQAQTALLNHKPRIYESALQQAQIWINEYYATDKPAVQLIINDLKQLAHYEIAADYPEIQLQSAALVNKTSVKNEIKREVQQQIEAQQEPETELKSIQKPEARPVISAGATL